IGSVHQKYIVLHRTTHGYFYSSPMVICGSNSLSFPVGTSIMR
nr:hypothetical protein [Tanacetum cinerariifolium]